MSTDPHDSMAVDLDAHVNGEPVRDRVESRLLLSDYLRHHLGLTGTHVGCEHGVCGACTVLVDGVAQRSCLMFAAQISGREVTTIEGLSRPDEPLHPVQRAFSDERGLQCGFCTPGFVLSTVALVAANPDPSDDEIIETVSSNICRCTGYRSILAAVRRSCEAGVQPQPPASPTAAGPDRGRA